MGTFKAPETTKAVREALLAHAEDFVRRRLAPATPPNDGRQTPMPALE